MIAHTLLVFTQSKHSSSSFHAHACEEMVSTVAYHENYTNRQHWKHDA